MRIEQKIKYGVKFNGVSNRVTTGSSSIYDVDKITVSYWIYPLDPIKSGGGSGWRTVLRKSLPDFWDEYNLSNGKLYVRMYDTSDTLHTFISNNSEWIGWNYVVWSYDGNDFKIYVNGVLDSSTNDSFEIRKSTSGLDIGASSSVQWWYGYIASIKIYNRALSDTEIKWNYFNPNEPITNGLILWFDARTFDESANLWYDLSGNDKHATNYGATKVRLVDEEVRVK